MYPHRALVQLPTMLLRAGLVAAVPAAVAGLADYVHGHVEQQRVGVVHATGNSLALGCYFGSLRLRAADRRVPALAASSTGHLVRAVSAALGGQGVPTEWTDVGAFDGLGDGEPAKRFDVYGIPESRPPQRGDG